MSVGPVAAGATPVELRTDTRRLHKLTWPGGRLAALRAMVDGAGSGDGLAQAVRGVVYSATGALVASSAAVSVDRAQVLQNGSAEVDLSSIVAQNATVTRDPTVASTGTASVKVVTAGAGVAEGVSYIGPTDGSVVPRSRAYAAARVYAATAGATVRFGFRESNSAGTSLGETVSSTFTLSAGWQVIYGLAPAITTATTVNLNLKLYTPTAQAVTFWVDDAWLWTDQAGQGRPLPLPLSQPVDLAAGDYYVGVQADGASRVARIYGDTMAPTLPPMIVPNPRHLDTTVGYSKLYVGLNTSSVTSIAGSGGVRGTLSSAALGGPYYASAAITTSSPLNPRRDIAVTPGRSYCAGAIFTNIGDARSVRAQMIYRDAAGQNIAAGVSNGGTIVGSSTVTTGTSICAATVAPDNAVTLAMTFYRLAGGSAAAGDIVNVPLWCAYESSTFPGFFDGSMPGWGWDGDANASISRGPYATVNAAAFGSMESSDVLNATAASETSVQTGRVTANTTQTALTIDTAVKRSGSQSVRAEQTAGPSIPVQSYSPSAPAGTYTAALWVLATAGTSLRLDGSQRDGAVLQQNAFTATGAWQRVTVNFVAYAPGAGWKLRVTAGATTFWIDDGVVCSGTLSAAAVPDGPAFTPSGTPGASIGILPLAGPEQADAFADGPAATATPPLGAQTPGTMTLAMGQDVTGPAAGLAGDLAAAGAGVLRFALRSAQTAETGLQGAGTAVLRGGADLSTDLGATGAGTLALRGGATMDLETALAGSGTLAFSVEATLDLSTDLEGAGTAALAGGADLAASFETAGFGRLLLGGAGAALRLETALQGFGGLLVESRGPLGLSAGLATAGAGTLRRRVIPGGYPDTPATGSVSADRPDAGVASQGTPRAGSATRR